jgi:hypothetical protein
LELKFSSDAEKSVTEDILATSCRSTNHSAYVKLKLSICLTKHHAMKTYLGVEVQFHAFFTSALHGGEWPVSCPGLLTRRLLFFKLFNLYGEARKKYKLTIKQFNDPFLCMIYNYVNFSRYNIRISPSP